MDKKLNQPELIDVLMRSRNLGLSNSKKRESKAASLSSFFATGNINKAHLINDFIFSKY